MRSNARMWRLTLWTLTEASRRSWCFSVDDVSGTCVVLPTGVFFDFADEASVAFAADDTAAGCDTGAATGAAAGAGTSSAVALEEDRREAEDVGAEDVGAEDVDAEDVETAGMRAFGVAAMAEPAGSVIVDSASA